MCPPLIAAATFAVGALSAYAEYSAGVDQANLQTTQHYANKQNAEAALRSDYSQIGLRQIQEGEKRVAESQKLRLEEARAKSRARVSAAEAGVTGLSVDSLVADIGAQAELEEASRKYNYFSTINQLGEEGKAAQARAHSRILSTPKGMKPSKLSLIAGIGGAGVKAFGGKV